MGRKRKTKTDVDAGSTQENSSSIKEANDGKQKLASVALPPTNSPKKRKRKRPRSSSSSTTRSKSPTSSQEILASSPSSKKIKPASATSTSTRAQQTKVMVPKRSEAKAKDQVKTVSPLSPRRSFRQIEKKSSGASNTNTNPGTSNKQDSNLKLRIKDTKPLNGSNAFKKYSQAIQKSIVSTITGIPSFPSNDSSQFKFNANGHTFRIPKIKTGPIYPDNPERKKMPTKNNTKTSTSTDKQEFLRTGKTQVKTPSGESQTSTIKISSQAKPGQSSTSNKHLGPKPNASTVALNVTPKTNPNPDVFVQNININHMSQHSTADLDLPDYDSDDDSEDGDFEKMEWENQMPQILKLVREDTSLTATPASTNYSTNTYNTNNRIVEECIDMDVDMEPVVDGDTLKQLIFVPDTNIWISNTGLLEVLLQKDFPFVASVTIVIPWMVLQELDVADHMKNSAQKAKIRKPINFIFSLLSKKHPRVRGQQAAEATVSKLQFDEIVADDSILNCVFQLQKNNNNTVVFLSNDRNLLNKALVNGVHACDSQTLFSKVNDIFGQKGQDTHDSCSDKRALVNLGHLPTAKTNGKIDLQSTKEMSLGDSILDLDPGDVDMPDASMEFEGKKRNNATIKSQGNAAIPAWAETPILQALLTGFDHIIRRKMIEDYGVEGWEFALKVKPPWNIRTAIQCIDTHWIANFSFVFSPKSKRSLETLQDLVKSYAIGSTERRKLLENKIVEAACSLFNFLTDKNMEQESPVLECKKVLLEYSVHMLSK